jgi:hypothetical protein
MQQNTDKESQTVWSLVEKFYPNYNDSIEMKTANVIDEILTKSDDEWSSDANLVWYTLGKDFDRISKAQDAALKEIYRITLEQIINAKILK